MTDHPDTVLQRRMMAQADEIRDLKAKLAEALDKADRKQRAAKAMNQQRNAAEKALTGERSAESTLQSINDRLRRQLAEKERLVAHWQSKANKNRGDVARLTAENEQLRADKRNLTFDINKTRKHVEQLQERVQ